MHEPRQLLMFLLKDSLTWWLLGHNSIEEISFFVLLKEAKGIVVG